MNRKSTSSILVLLVATVFAATELQSASSNRTTTRQSRQDREAALTPGREAAALAFARSHHPELANLVVKLKRAKPTEYKEALSEIFRDSESLASVHSKDRERYELELSAWKLDSRIRLVAARLKRSSSPRLKESVRRLIAQRHDIRIETQKLTLRRLNKRIKQTRDQLTRLEERKESYVQRSFDRLEKIAQGKKLRNQPKSTRTKPASAPRKRPARTPKTRTPQTGQVQTPNP